MTQLRLVKCSTQHAGPFHLTQLLFKNDYTAGLKWTQNGLEFKITQNDYSNNTRNSNNYNIHPGMDKNVEKSKNVWMWGKKAMVKC